MCGREAEKFYLVPDGFPEYVGGNGGPEAMALCASHHVKAAEYWEGRGVRIVECTKKEFTDWNSMILVMKA